MNRIRQIANILTKSALRWSLVKMAYTFLLALKKPPLYQHSKMTTVSFMYILSEEVPMCEFLYEWSRLSCFASCGPYIHVAKTQEGWMRHIEIFEGEILNFYFEGFERLKRFKLIFAHVKCIHWKKVGLETYSP